MNEYVVRPVPDGTWAWEYLEDGTAQHGAGGIATRAEAIASARSDRDGPAAILLARRNGSIVGELSPASEATDIAQLLDIEPAEQRNGGGA